MGGQGREDEVPEAFGREPVAILKGHELTMDTESGLQSGDEMKVGSLAFDHAPEEIVEGHEDRLYWIARISGPVRTRNTAGDEIVVTFREEGGFPCYQAIP
jgi:hypothetical protein